MSIPGIPNVPEDDGPVFNMEFIPDDIVQISSREMRFLIFKQLLKKTDGYPTTFEKIMEDTVDIEQFVNGAENDPD